MKKMRSKVYALLYVVAMTAGLVACGRETETAEAYSVGTNQQSEAASVGANPTYETPRNWTVEELGEIIVAAGEFWNDWWNLRGAFAWEHLYESPWYYWSEQPYHPRSRGYYVLLPSSGFETITDIALHLQQFYTDIWINREMFGDEPTEPTIGDFEIFFGNPSAFEEYDGVLYVAAVRWGAMRPDWTTATHTLISQYDNIAVVAAWNVRVIMQN